MWIYIITWVATFFAFKVFNSYVSRVLSGLLWVSTGIYRISLDPDIWHYIVTGVILITMGVYIMVMVGVDLIKGD